MIKIAIQDKNNSFSNRWIAYCKKSCIPYKIVNCYDNNIINQLEDCDALMWHVHHASAKDYLFAKQLLFSVKAMGKEIFPDINSLWHFDDKVAQKYLLEALGTPLVPAYIFYTRDEANKWIDLTFFPKVFKLRGGAGSVNVSLVQNKSQAKKLTKKAFSSGFPHDSLVPFSELYKKYKKGKITLADLAKGFLRRLKTTDFAKIHGKEIGYIYFQDFIPNNDSDTRVIVIGDKAYAIKRMVRKNDFRASGSGQILFDKDLIDVNAVKIAFETSEKINARCLAYDFVFQNDQPLIVEISFAFAIEAYDACPGYWDKGMNWHQGKFNPQEWMVQDLIKLI